MIVLISVSPFSSIIPAVSPFRFPVRLSARFNYLRYITYCPFSN